MISSDMAKTVEFYQGVLGLELVKTMELPDGGQHFFFDVGNGDCLAFFWFTDSRPAAPGVAAPAWIGDVSAFGSMHHVAFKVDADQVERYRDVLKQRGVKCAAVAHYLDGSMGETVDDDTFAYSIYFQDPDGITIEFCAWLPAYDKIGNQHQPVQALTPTPA
jgi:catechol 2,3-dioxygenase-like lactoylglutathione lyase family enzyme